MGPTCEVLLDTDDAAALNVIDAVLTAATDRIDRTGKGRVWDVCVAGRQVNVSVAGEQRMGTAEFDITFALPRKKFEHLRNVLRLVFVGSAHWSSTTSNLPCSGRRA